jgi:hypothetical protein
LRYNRYPLANVPGLPALNFLFKPHVIAAIEKTQVYPQDHWWALTRGTILPF